MVKITGSSGKTVDVEIRGVAEVIEELRRINRDIKDDLQLTTVRMGTFMEEEVKDSILGNRAEKKSVDTGTLANSIKVSFPGEYTAVVKPERKSYSKGGTSTVQVAGFLEYGTTRITPRRHFRNSESRNKSKIRFNK